VRAPFPFAPELRLCAAALAGDADALAELASRPEVAPLVAANRIGPGLAIRAAEHRLDGEQVLNWNEQMRTAAGLRLQLLAAMRDLSRALAAAGIPWTPLKGMGLDPRLYPHPEERLSTDIDALVSPADLEPAVRALVDGGWHDLVETDRQRAYTLDEGYNWKLARGPIVLELHFRLWGGVPERLAADILERAAPAPELGATARRVDPADAYLVAAVHVWQTPPPRYLMLWWDLHRMASIADPGLADTVIGRTTGYGLDAPVALSAAVAADLWGHELNARIADALEPHLRAPERWAARRLARSSPITASLGTLTLGRLLARRPSRSGWRAIPRRIWAHPGNVDADTPASWSWPRRRLTHLARALHLLSP
jgi:hypothetical protein